MRQSDPLAFGRLSRRVVLRGAGVALCLPFFESLRPRSARAKPAAPPPRFVPIFLPNGAPEFWKPPQTGAGTAWVLSSVLEPLVSLKPQVTVVSGLENGSVFGDSSSVQPAARQTGAWLTCADGAKRRAQHPEQPDINSVSVDQVIAGAIGDTTPLPSLQLGLTSIKSYCDGAPCSFSRSVSFDPEGKALYKVVDPKQAFKLLTGALPGGYAPGLVSKAAQTSVLDTVLASAKVVQSRLARHDQRRLEEFLEAVRGVEGKLTEPAVSSCRLPGEPVFPDLSGGAQYGDNTPPYNKGTHADLMNELIALALQCGVTRVISHMLEDERSDFRYENVQRRTFGETTSTLSTGVCDTYVGASRDSQDHFASITRWNVSKVGELCQKLALLSESDGSMVLDNTVVFLGAATHGAGQPCEQLPAVLIGSGGGKLRTDRHVDLLNRPMRDLYLTIMNQVFELGVETFGENLTNQPISMIESLCAV